MPADKSVGESGPNLGWPRTMLIHTDAILCNVKTFESLREEWIFIFSTFYFFLKLKGRKHYKKGIRYGAISSPLSF